jgi:hypothetical protein
LPLDFNMKKGQKTILKNLRDLWGNRFLFILCMLLASMTAKTQETTLVVVGNQSGGTPAGMKLSELRSVLKAETQRWANGNRIVIALMRPNTTIGKNTSSKLYDMSGDELNKFWMSLVFQGKAPPPKFFNTTSELEDYVAQNPGAIGVIDQLLANNDVKIIAIDGKNQFSL